jgi:P27 family predicted phage terminase small subunit
MSNRPKPTALKRLEGNPGKRPLNDSEPSYAVEAPEKPVIVMLYPEASAEWDRVVPELVASGVMTRVDLAALTCYCLAWAHVAQAEVEIHAHGILVPVMVEDADGAYIDSGNRKKNAAVTVLNESMRNVRAFASEYGITPASRTKVKVEKPATEDPLDFLDEESSEHITQ